MRAKIVNVGFASQKPARVCGENSLMATKFLENEGQQEKKEEDARAGDERSDFLSGSEACAGNYFFQAVAPFSLFLVA